MIVLGLAAPAGAAPQTVDVYLFWRVGCPHCEREIDFLERLGAEEPLGAVMILRPEWLAFA